MFVLSSPSLEQSSVQNWLRDALVELELDAILYIEKPEEWMAVWEQLTYQPIAASRPMLEYQKAYLEGAGQKVFDLSLLLRSDGCPIGLLPLSLCHADSWQLTTMGAPISAPLFVKGLSPRTEKKVCLRTISVLKRLAADIGQQALLSEQSCWSHELSACTEWHQQLMSAGAMIQTRHDLFTDLSPGLATIRSKFRKSYRPLINLALKIWQVEVMNANNADAGVWAEFKQLHKDVAGRSTRSDDTWVRQWQMVCANKAFLVTLRDPKDSRLVGAGLFQFTRDEGVYAVGAYDRSLFDKPLGHAVQQKAIETFVSLGVRWYLVGERHYLQSLHAPTHKEITISEFKQGFASHLFCRQQFMLALDHVGEAKVENFKA